MREILAQGEPPTRERSLVDRGIAIGEATLELLNACSRLLDLLGQPEDIPFLNKPIQHEIVYRLLRGPPRRTAPRHRNVRWAEPQDLQGDFFAPGKLHQPLRLEELAEVVHMGMSTLHHHFHALTAMSPLQYQKQLRLVAARERMLADRLDVTSAAFAVGYESPSQFRREYKRFFGEPPMRDMQRRRLPTSPMTAQKNPDSCSI